MRLRDYQGEANDRIYDAWHHGAQNVMLQMPTGGGKTLIFCEIASHNEDGVMIIAHRGEILSQISLTLARYEIRHDIIGSKQVIRNCISLHLHELNKSYYDERSRTCIASVDTLIKMNESWFKEVTLVIQDEAHHVLKKNKWGKAAALFPNAQGLYVTATPLRADGQGLGRNADGIIDELVIGESTYNLIQQGHLTEYKIIASQTDIDLSSVNITAAGDYSPEKLRRAVHKSTITGDVVKHYLKFAEGKQGVTFAVDIESATEIANSFRDAGVATEVITGKTPDLIRAKIMRQFRDRQILQLVNVDLLGEGVDVPAIEVVSLARPTHSLAVYRQQIGRALRPAIGKSHAIIIDHVGNVVRHGLPDAHKKWSLERRDRKFRGTPEDVVPLRNCLKCYSVYPRIKRVCPYCGHYLEPISRTGPEFVDGDLIELDSNTLYHMRQEIHRIDAAPKIPHGADSIVQRSIMKRHAERHQEQVKLRETMAQWAGFYKHLEYEDSEIHRLFYFTFNIDILSAQMLNARAAQELIEKIKYDIGISFTESDTRRGMQKGGTVMAK